MILFSKYLIKRPCKSVTTDTVMKNFVILDCRNCNKIGIAEGGIGVREISIYISCYIVIYFILTEIFG